MTNTLRDMTDEEFLEYIDKLDAAYLETNVQETFKLIYEAERRANKIRQFHSEEPDLEF